MTWSVAATSCPIDRQAPLDNADDTMDVIRVAADNSSSTDLRDLGDSSGMLIVDGSNHVTTATFSSFSGALFVTDTNGFFVFE